MPNASEAKLRYLDPSKPLERRRSSVRTPPLDCQVTPEVFYWLDTTLPLSRAPNTELAQIWEHVFNTIRENKPYPIPLDNAIEIMRLLALVKKDSPF
jgi:hypothetical protein